MVMDRSDWLMISHGNLFVAVSFARDRHPNSLRCSRAYLVELLERQHVTLEDVWREFAGDNLPVPEIKEPEPKRSKPVRRSKGLPIQLSLEG